MGVTVKNYYKASGYTVCLLVNSIPKITFTNGKNIDLDNLCYNYLASFKYKVKV